MYPHERSLVTRLAGKPFALIGVNTDRDLGTIREIVKDKNLIWRSFFDPGGGKISVEYDVEGFPTIILIDHNGVIRHRSFSMSGEKLDELIDELVAAAGA